MGIVISNDLVLNQSALDQPLTHARWGYRKISGTVSASSESAGAPAVSADNSMTYTFWKPASLPATWQIIPSTPETCNYFGIAAHTLGSTSTTVAIEYYNGSAWVEIDSAIPADDRPIMFLFEDVTASQWRISLTGAGVPRVGVIYIGKTLDMQRAIYGGHSPITLSRDTIIRNNVSESGQWLGRSIRRSGSSTSFTWQNLKAEWYRNNFDPLVEHLRTEPAFIAWRPLGYQSEVAYIWTSGDIRPSNMGTRDFMEVTVAAEGLGIE